MKALVYVAPERMEIQEIPEPPPAAGEVLLKVGAAGVCGSDLHGFLGHSERRKPGLVMGHEAVATILELHPSVRGWRRGQRVCFNPLLTCGSCRACLEGRQNLCPTWTLFGMDRLHGTYAERIAVPVVNVLPKPARLSFEEAAAVPLVFLTAWNMLVTHGRIRAGDAVLIWGAGSGVGSAAVQIARAFGARIIATAGAAWKLDRARALGADHVVNHAEQTVSDEVRAFTDRRGVDIVFDHLGKETWETSLKSLARGGRLVTCGATSGAEATTDIRYIYGRQLSIYGTWVGAKRELHEVMRLIAAGRLQPTVHAVLPLAQAAEAHRMMERREQFGKIVLVP